MRDYDKNIMNDSPYYKDTGKIALASKISVRFREKMFDKFMSNLRPDTQHTVLDIGVTSDYTYQESNYFERLYPYKDRIVCVGTEDGSYLEKKYPGIIFIQINPHESLPFNNSEFDIAFSNAVIEHVGSWENQRAFILEMLRVSRSFFITTPNRWFPIEFHTAWPLMHFLPKRMYRAMLAALGEFYWSKEENLNLLSRKELKALFPKKVKVTIDSIRILGLSTNLIAYGKSH
jgi:SAM-dependent methyltransferase